MTMPAAEFTEWQAFFNIYPFSEDRADIRNAQLISWITYISSLTAQGKGLRKQIPPSELMPNYLKQKKQPATKSLEQQAAEFAAFHTKLKALSPNTDKTL